VTDQPGLRRLRVVRRDDQQTGRTGFLGVPCELEEWPGMIHQWQLYAAELAEARQALEKVDRFLARQFA